MSFFGNVFGGSGADDDKSAQHAHSVGDDQQVSSDHTDENIAHRAHEAVDTTGQVAQQTIDNAEEVKQAAEQMAHEGIELVDEEIEQVQDQARKQAQQVAREAEEVAHDAVDSLDEDNR